MVSGVLLNEQNSGNGSNLHRTIPCPFLLGVVALSKLPASKQHGSVSNCPPRGCCTAVNPLFSVLRFSRFLGLYPNLENYNNGDYFDLLNACFTAKKPFHSSFIQSDDASRLVNLMRMNYETMHLFAMSRVERNRCLLIIIDYYRLHLPEFPPLKSLDTLKELFD